MSLIYYLIVWFSKRYISDSKLNEANITAIFLTRFNYIKY